MTATSLARRASDLRSMLDKSKEQIQMALPRHLTPERMIRVALTAARKDSKIMNCNLTSIVGAVVEASQLGLEPDGVLGYAYLVPYGQTCTLIPGYRGLIALAKRSGEVANIWANPVFKDDEFRYEEGLHRDLVHVPNLTVEDRENPDKMVYVYAVITFRDGRDADFEVMTTAQVRGIQGRARAKGGPWSTDFVEMARKTAIKRLLKRHDLSPEVARAQALDDRALSGDIVTDFEVNGEEEPKKGSLEAYTEEMQARYREHETWEPIELKDPGRLAVDSSDLPTEEEGQQAPDRRRRTTLRRTINECIAKMGQEPALKVRDRWLADNGNPTPNPDTMDIKLLRSLCQTMEAEAALVDVKVD